MSQQFTLAGDATLTLQNSDGSNQRTFAELANNDAIVVAFNDETGTMDALKGGAIFSINVAAKKATLTVRVVKAGSDDAWLNQRLNELLNQGTSAKSLNGSVIGNFGDGQGNLRKLTVTLTFGFVKKRPNARTNYSGDNEQAINEYTIDFGLSELVSN
jgi:hypothetical protein